MSDRDLDAMVERMAREEQDDLDRGRGEHILAMINGGAEAKEAQHRGLLDAIGRAQLAKENPKTDKAE
jgi:hypothetical protein